jgi:hypothetical protein
MFEIKYMPGQEAYTAGELEMLYRLVSQAALEDPGEQEEAFIERAENG